MRLSSFERKSSVRVRNCVSQPRISSERKTNNASPSLTGWPSSTATRLMMACRGDCIGSAPVAGIRTNWQWTVSGNRITIATSSANRKAASNSQAVDRMIQGGGCLIKNQHWRIIINRTGDCDALLLATRKRKTRFANLCLVTKWKTHNEIVRRSDLCGGEQPVDIWLQIAKRNIARNRFVKHV